MKTCFVISPIGDKDSDIRKSADDLFDLVIEPALEKYDFQVIRADKISSASSITTEVIQLVQNADLCIVDITGHNANVMYECGRRHETGKPYIMVARVGQSLPFDITTIRTIFYELSSGREIRKVVRTIQGFVDKLLAEGFGPQSAGESLSSIADALKRIERKLDRYGSPSAQRLAGTAMSSNVKDVLKSLTPTEAFSLALSQRDMALAEGLLPILEKQLDRDYYLKAAVCQAVGLRSNLALHIVEEEIEKLDDWTDEDVRQNLVGAYAEGMSAKGREAEALEKLRGFFEQVRRSAAPSGTLTLEGKAFYLNQYQRLLYGLKKYAQAAEIGAEVIAMCPNDSAYYYNLSMTFEKLENREKMTECIDKYLALDAASHEEDGDHLERAVELYCMVGRIADAKEVLERLRVANPYKAELVMEDEDVRKRLGD